MKARYIKEVINKLPDDEEVALWFELMTDMNDYRREEGLEPLTESQWDRSVHRWDKVSAAWAPDLWDFLLECIEEMTDNEAQETIEGLEEGGEE